VPSGAVFVGGNFNNGRNGGPLYFNCNNNPSNVNINRLARLFTTKKLKLNYAHLVPYRSVKIVAKARVSKRL